jgi:uncharacterized tellurite resistance protein B-like protein
MEMIAFNETQKAAIVSLLIEMINADAQVDPNECVEFDSICVEYGICEDTFRLGRSLDSMVAIDIMKRMTDFQKIKTAQLLIRVIDADSNDDDREIQLFNIICKATGVDILVNTMLGE